MVPFPWALPLWVQAILGGLTITVGELLTGLWCLLAGPLIVGFDWRLLAVRQILQ